MTRQEVLLKMLQWVEGEIENAKKPQAEKFVLTSLAFCASKVTNFVESQDAIACLHLAAPEGRDATFDVVTPSEATERIQYALLKYA